MTSSLLFPQSTLAVILMMRRVRMIWWWALLAISHNVQLSWLAQLRTQEPAIVNATPASYLPRTWGLIWNVGWLTDKWWQLCNDYWTGKLLPFFSCCISHSHRQNSLPLFLFDSVSYFRHWMPIPHNWGSCLSSWWICCSTWWMVRWTHHCLLQWWWDYK